MVSDFFDKEEHLSEAAVREVLEETGIKAEFKNHLGFVSEHLVESNLVTQHFLLHLCQLSPLTTSITSGAEGRVAWFDLSNPILKEILVPSDYEMMDRIILNKEKNYYNCILEKIDNNHYPK